MECVVKHVNLESEFSHKYGENFSSVKTYSVAICFHGSTITNVKCFFICPANYDFLLM